MRWMIALAVVFACYGVAVAEDGAKKRPGGPDREALIKKFDANGDGKLDEAERAKAKEAFAGGRPGGKPGDRKPGAGGPGGFDREALLKKFDENGDGKLDEAERAKAKEAFAKNRGDKKPGDRKPGDRKPGDRKPGDRKPGEKKNDAT